MTERDPCTAAIAEFLDESGYPAIWHNNWQFSIGGAGQQWVICVINGRIGEDVYEIEVGPGMDNTQAWDDIDSNYIELAAQNAFEKLLELITKLGVKPLPEQPFGDDEDWNRVIGRSFGG